LQGFIVEDKNYGNTSPSAAEFTFSEAMTSVNKETVELRSSVSPQNTLDIVARNQTAEVRTFIARRAGGQTAFGNSDARKIIHSINDIPEVYTLKTYKSGMIATAINIINNEELLIPLGLATSFSGNITLSFSGMESYDANLILIDAVANKAIDLTGLASFDYTFNYAPKKKANGEPVTCEDRFFIRISKTVTGIPQTLAGKVNVFESNGLIQVVSSASNPLKELSVYDMQGKLIYKANANNAVSHTIERNWPAGVYVVKVVSEKGVDNVKVVKK